MSTDVLPLLIFLGMGALTDFEPVLSNPKTLLLGAAAQFGVFIALVGALLISLTPIFDFGLLEGIKTNQNHIQLGYCQILTLSTFKMKLKKNTCSQVWLMEQYIPLIPDTENQKKIFIIFY